MDEQEEGEGGVPFFAKPAQRVLGGVVPAPIEAPRDLMPLPFGDGCGGLLGGKLVVIVIKALGQAELRFQDEGTHHGGRLESMALQPLGQRLALHRQLQPILQHAVPKRVE
ncbi:MAG: hypothetical protein JRG95_24380 [Deltaproteobacteria bacterium]|nr:hypothetical protein [Deltaproteobacteria bacterium]